MNPKHVTDLELSKQLFKAGITKDFESEFYWVNKYRGVNQNGHTVYWEDQYEVKICEDIYEQPENIPALLLSELLEIMPSGNVSLDTVRIIFEAKQGKKFRASYYPDSPSPMEAEKFYTTKTPLEALSSLASYLLREGKFNNTKHE